MAGSVFVRGTETSVTEANTTVLVRIDRTGSVSGDVTIVYGVDGATATAGEDYIGNGGTIVMADGVASVSVPIAILDDAIGEATEVVTLSLITATGADLVAPRTHRISILDDENPLPPPPVEPPLVSPYSVTKSLLVDGLTAPVRFAFSPLDPNLLYVAEKAGVVRLVDIRTGASDTVLDIRGQVNNAGDRGLQDVVLHPDFVNQPYVYVFYVVDPPGVAANSGNAGADGRGNRFSRVVRYTADAANDYRTLIPGSEVVILGGAGQDLADISGGGAVDFSDPTTVAALASDRVAEPDDRVIGGIKQDFLKADSLTHQGGRMLFGPDGKLYILTGDGAAYNYVDPRTMDVQSLDSLSGKVLRVDPLTGQGLADNPFAAQAEDLDANRAKIYQSGLRNPFASSFDEEGHLILADVGWFSFEEINIGGPGANFGWPFFEGGDGGIALRTPLFRNTAEAQAFYAQVADGTITVTAPFRAFSHDSSAPGFEVQAIVGGGVVSSHSVYPTQLHGNFVFADFVGGDVYAVNIADSTDSIFLYDWSDSFGPVFLLEGPDGYLYYADLITGELGRLNISLSSDNLIGSAGADTLLGSAADNVITGLAGPDLLFGGDGNDLFAAQAGDGNETVDGGTGNDTYSLKDLRDPVVISLQTGIATGRQIGTDRLVSIETVLSGAGGDRITGSTGADRLLGFGGADTMDGGEGNDSVEGGIGDDILTGGADDDFLLGGVGADTMDGGAGIDTLSYGGSAGAVTVDLATGTASGGDSTGDRVTGFENLIGGKGADRLTGSSGANLLSGGIGNDTLTGGGGIDWFLVGIATDRVTDLGLGGSDVLVVSSGATANATLAASWIATAASVNAGTANLTASGFRANLAAAGGTHGWFVTNRTNAIGVSLTGSSLADTLRGGNGNDIIVGGRGGDSLNGGDGVDTVSYAGSSGSVTVNLATGAASGGDAAGDSVVAFENAIGGTGDDSLTGTGGANALTGGGGNDTLSGGNGNDSLQGGDGDDVLIGGPGADWLSGGLGMDTASYAGSVAGVVVNMETGLGSAGDAAGDTLAGFQTVVGGSGNDTLTGNAGANTLIGGSGNDTMAGGGGHDTLQGGIGNDVLTGGTGLDRFVVESGTDRVTDLGLGGGDALAVAVGATANATLAAAWTASAASVNAGTIGLIAAGFQANLTAATGGSGWSVTNSGNTTAIAFIGSTHADSLTGGDANDTLTGGGGADRLVGGGGGDVFRFLAVTDSPVGVLRDIIVDFKVVDGDRLDLRSIDANSLVLGNQAFVSIGSAVFSGAAGELRLASGILQADVSGDGAADMEIELTGVFALGPESVLL